MAKISEQEKQWRAEDDARTLAEAERIKNDKTRLNPAINAAQKTAAEMQERTKALQKVASIKPKTGTTSSKKR